MAVRGGARRTQRGANGPAVESRSVRPDRVIAGTALVAILALVAVPGTVGHQPAPPSVAPEAFEPVVLDDAVGMAATFDPANDSASAVDARSVLTEPAPQPSERTAPGFRRVTVRAESVRRPARRAAPGASSASGSGWNRSGSSWYGPGLFGNGTACGQTLTATLVGVAHRTLPCGTLVAFRNPANGRVVLARVVDRGPYVAGRTWDLTAGLCQALDHCYTAPIDWRIP